MIRTLAFALLFALSLSSCATYVRDEYGTSYRRKPHSNFFRKINSTDTTDYEIAGRLKKKDLKDPIWGTYGAVQVNGHK